MTSILASPETDNDRIERWREETSLTPERHSGTIARIFDTCLELLRILLRHSSPTWVTTSGNRKLRQCHSILQLWNHGHGVVEGRLDSHLEQSTEVRQAAIEVLLHLCGCLLDGVSTFVLPQVEEESVKLQYTLASDLYSQRKWLLKTADESSSEEDDDSGEDNAEYNSLSTRADTLIRRVKTYTDCLMGFGAALDCPAPDETHNETPGIAGEVPLSAHDYHTELIRRKYDKAETRLLQTLGQVSWSRFLRMQNQREHNATAIDEPQQRTIPHVTKSIGTVSEFQDSGIGTSLAKTQSSYAESIVSFMTSISGGEGVRIPPLPAEGKNGLAFECTACGKRVRATNNREWRKHLFADLQPYTCFYSECQFSTNPLPSRQVWKDHLELEHKFGPAWQAVKCPLCLDTTGNGKSTILKHFARHMEDIALVALPPAVDSGAESDASVQLTDDTIEVRPTHPGESAQAPGTDMSRIQYPVWVTKTIKNGRILLRASCTACAASRVKCTKEHPTCGRCSSQKLRCIYGNVSNHNAGLLQFKSSTGGECLVVLSRDDPEITILEENLSNVDLSSEGPDHIAWMQRNGDTVSIKFKNNEDCGFVRECLEEVNRRPAHARDQDGIMEERVSSERDDEGETGTAMVTAMAPPETEEAAERA